jgi:Flp pilus assembly protein protease CpaA
MSAARSSKLRTIWPELLAATGLLLVVFRLARVISAENDGTFGYCLDDAYIHLAMAKNLVEHHVWGVTRHAFSSSSSSPLWILLLAGDFLIQGANTTVPLALNLLAATAALFVAGTLLRRRGLPQPLVLVLLLAIVLLTPLPTLILEGMEHSLHILLVVLWIALLDQPLRTHGALTARRLAALGALAALLTVCRFESLFLVFVTCAVLFLRRQRRDAIVLGVCAWASVGAFAIFSILHGWHALPNSVLVKAARRDWHSVEGIVSALGGRSLRQLASTPHMAVLVGLAVVGLWWLGRGTRRSALEAPRALLILFLGTTLLHLQFAQLDWFFRYEDYLIVLGIVTLGLAAAEGSLLPVPRWAAALVVAGLAVPLGLRTIEATQKTPLAAKNIHDQQWQLGQFLREKMGSRIVALNDIGGPSYLSAVHIVDLAGLASLDTANVIMSGGYTPESFEDLTRRNHVELVAIHEAPFASVIPRTWKMIGQWKAPDNVILTQDVVTFYAADPTKAPELAARLAEFSQTRLPPDVLSRLY